MSLLVLKSEGPYVLSTTSTTTTAAAFFVKIWSKFVSCSSMLRSGGPNVLSTASYSRLRGLCAIHFRPEVIPFNVLIMPILSEIEAKITL